MEVADIRSGTRECIGKLQPDGWRVFSFNVSKCSGHYIQHDGKLKKMTVKEALARSTRRQGPQGGMRGASRVNNSSKHHGTSP